MTKAERIFTATRYECKKHIEDWGYQINPNGTAVGYNGLTYKDNETISMRTINAVAALLASKRKYLVLDQKLGVITAEQTEKETQILNMVESTLNSSRKSIEDFNKMLKEI